MNKPTRYLTRMTVFVAIVLAIAALLFPMLVTAFMHNPGLNGLILVVAVLGILYNFRLVWRLKPEVSWIESYRSGVPPVSDDRVPTLLAPMATMLGERKDHRVSLSAISMRSILDSVGARLEESRDISRYLTGLLIFLGLLGTFWGLLLTVSSVGEAIGALNAAGTTDIAGLLETLKTGLQGPLGGMGTAFGSSLFGLAGSLVLGFLDLQASQAQNRFYNDLEEWLSGVTRLSGGGLIEGGEQSVPAYLTALIEQTSDNLEGLQRTLARSEDGRVSANNNLLALTEKLTTLSDQMRTEQTLMIRLAESQLELKPILQRLAEAVGHAQTPIDEATRTHIRNLDVHVGRMAEELASGRDQMTQELRSEIRLLARTIAALAEETER